MSRKNTITLTMQPQCKVFGKVAAKDPQTGNRKNIRTWVDVCLDNPMERPMEFMSDKGEYHFYLPPGTYTVDARGEGTQNVPKTITVKPGQQELEVEPIDLPPPGPGALPGIQ